MFIIGYKHSKDDCGLLLVFGAGLIGYNVIFSLQGHAFFQVEMPFSWNSLKKQEEDENIIVTHLKLWGSIFPDKKTKYVSIVWSAGKGGFNSSEKELENEMISFKKVICLLEKIQEIFPNSHCFFHMISSAGGLFEGQCGVGIDSVPNPKRAYGILKLRQEHYLLKKDIDAPKIIYRPSSVYGFSGSGRRLGLVPTLMLNAIKNKVSTIYGGMNTLRDYLFASDIGKFIVMNILNSSFKDSVFILANGKPSTICEIIKKIEFVVNRKFYVRYELSDINSADNSYSIKTIPQCFNFTDLDTGIRKTYISLAKSGYRPI
jgi:nucleoside-diphosphate-sugar epimerase